MSTPIKKVNKLNSNKDDSNWMNNFSSSSSSSSKNNVNDSLTSDGMDSPINMDNSFHILGGSPTPIKSSNSKSNNNNANSLSKILSLSPMTPHVMLQRDALFSPDGGDLIKSNDSKKSRSLIKVYMDNQLDLNSNELEYYEAVVNKFAEQLEEIQIERDNNKENYVIETNKLANINEVLNNKLKESENNIVKLNKDIININSDHLNKLEIEMKKNVELNNNNENLLQNLTNEYNKVMNFEKMIEEINNSLFSITTDRDNLLIQQINWNNIKIELDKNIYSISNEKEILEDSILNLQQDIKAKEDEMKQINEMFDMLSERHDDKVMENKNLSIKSQLLEQEIEEYKQSINKLLFNESNKNNNNNNSGDINLIQEILNEKIVMYNELEKNQNNLISTIDNLKESLLNKTNQIKDLSILLDNNNNSLSIMASSSKEFEELKIKYTNTNNRLIQQEEENHLLKSTSSYLNSNEDILNNIKIQLEDYKERNSLLLIEISNSNNNNNYLEENLKQKDEKILLLESIFDGVKIELAEYKIKNQTLIEEIEYCKLIISNNKTDFDNIQAKLLNYNVNIIDNSASINNNGDELEIVKSKLANLQIELKESKDRMQEYKLSELEIRDEELASTENIIEDIEAKLDETIQKNNLLEEEISRSDEEVVLIKISLKRLQSDLEKSLKICKEQQVQIEKNDNLEIVIEEMYKELEDFKEKNLKLNDQLNINNSNFKQLEIDLNDAKIQLESELFSNSLLTKERDEYIIELKTTSNTLYEVEDEVESIKKSNVDIRNQLDHFKDINEKLQVALNTKSEKLSLAEMVYNGLKVELELFKEKNQSLVEEVEANKIDFDNIQAKLFNLNASNVVVCNDDNSDLEIVKSKLANLQIELKESKERMQEYKLSELEIRDEELASTENIIEDIEAKLDETIQRNNLLKNDIGSKLEEINCIKAELLTTTNQLSSASSKLTLKEKEVEMLQEEIALISEELQIKNEEVLASNNDLDGLQELLELTEQKVMVLTVELNAKSEELSVKMEELVDLQIELNEKKFLIEEHEFKLSQLQIKEEELASTEKLLEDAQSQLELTEQKVFLLTDEINLKSDELTTSRNEITNLRIELKESSLLINEQNSQINNKIQDDFISIKNNSENKDLLIKLQLSEKNIITLSQQLQLKTDELKESKERMQEYKLSELQIRDEELASTENILDLTEQKVSLLTEEIAEKIEELAAANKELEQLRIELKESSLLIQDQSIKLKQLEFNEEKLIKTSEQLSSTDNIIDMQEKEILSLKDEITSISEELQLKNENLSSTNTGLDGLQDLLELTEQKVELLTSELKLKSEELETTKLSLISAENEVKESKERFNDFKTAELEIRDEELASTENILDLTEQKVSLLTEEIAEKIEELAAANKELEQLRIELKESSLLIQDQSIKLKQLEFNEEKLIKTSEQLSSTDNIIDMQEKEILSLKDEITSISDELSNTNTGLDGLQDLLELTEQKVELLTNELETSKLSLISFENEARESKERLNDFKVGELKIRDDELRSTEKFLEELQNQLDDVREKNLLLADEVQDRDKELLVSINVLNDLKLQLDNSKDTNILLNKEIVKKTEEINEYTHENNVNQLKYDALRLEFDLTKLQLKEQVKKFDQLLIEEQLISTNDQKIFIDLKLQFEEVRKSNENLLLQVQSKEEIINKNMLEIDAIKLELQEAKDHMNEFKLGELQNKEEELALNEKFLENIQLQVQELKDSNKLLTEELNLKEQNILLIQSELENNKYDLNRTRDEMLKDAYLIKEHSNNYEIEIEKYKEKNSLLSISLENNKEELSILTNEYDIIFKKLQDSLDNIEEKKEEIDKKDKEINLIEKTLEEVVIKYNSLKKEVYNEISENNSEINNRNIALEELNMKLDSSNNIILENTIIINEQKQALESQVNRYEECYDILMETKKSLIELDKTHQEMKYQYNEMLIKNDELLIAGATSHSYQLRLNKTELLLSESNKKLKDLEFNYNLLLEDNTSYKSMESPSKYYGNLSSNELQLTISNLESEIDVLKTRDVRLTNEVEHSRQIQLESEQILNNNEVEINNLQDMCDLLDNKTVELELLLKEKDDKLLLEKENNNNLRQLISNMGNSGNNNNNEVLQLTNDKDELYSKIKQLNIIIAEKSDSENHLRKRFNLLTKNTTELAKASASNDIIYEENRNKLQEEVNIMKNECNRIQEEVFNNNNTITMRLNALISEKEILIQEKLDLENKLHLQISNNIRVLDTNYQHSNSEFKELSQYIINYNVKMNKLQDLFINKCNSKFEILSKKIDKSYEKLQSISDDSFMKSNKTDKYNEIEKYSSNTKELNLIDSLKNQIFDYELENKRLVTEITNLQIDHELLDKELKDRKYFDKISMRNNKYNNRADGSTVSSNSSINSNSIDISNKSHLDSTNKSNDNSLMSKSLIQSNLEEECNKLTKLVQHLRDVNFKLNGDIKLLQENSIKYNNIENKLKVSINNENLVQQNLHSIEIKLQKKEIELRESQDIIEKYDYKYERLSSNHDKDIRKLKDLLVIADTKNNISSNNILQLQDSSSITINNLQDEIESLSLKLISQDTDISNKVKQILKYENNINNLTNLQEENNVLLNKNKSEILILNKKLLNDKENHNQIVLELKNELESCKESKKDLEGLIIPLQNQFETIKSKLRFKEEELTKYMSEYRNIGDDSRHLRVEIELKTSELITINKENNDIRQVNSKLNKEVDLSKRLLEDFKNNEHQKLLLKLNNYDNIVTELKNEKESIYRENVKILKDIDVLKDNIKLINNKNVSLLNEITTLNTRESSVISISDTMMIENDNLRDQIESIRVNNKQIIDKYIEKIEKLEAKLNYNSNQEDIYLSKLNDFEENYEILNKELIKILSLEDDINSVTSTLDNAINMNNVANSMNSPVKSNEKNIFSSPSPTKFPYNFTSALYSIDERLKERENDNTSIFNSSITNVYDNIHEKINNLQSKSEIFIRCKEKDNATIDKLQNDIILLKKIDIDNKKFSDIYEQQLRVLSTERDNLKLKLNNITDELNKSNYDIQMHASQNTDNVNNFNHFFQRISSTLSDIDTTIKTTVVRANNISKVSNLSNDLSQLTNKDKSNYSIVSSNVTSFESMNVLYNTIATSISNKNNELEIIFNGLNNMMESLYSNSNANKSMIEKLENNIKNKENEWLNERNDLINSINDLDEKNIKDSRMLAQSQGEIQGNNNEIERLRKLVSEYSRNNVDLESEFMNSNETIEELKLSLEEAELLCNDLNNKVKLIQNKYDDKVHENDILLNQLDMLRKKSSELEFNLEKNSNDLNTIHSERNLLENIKSNLENELNSMNKDLIQLKNEYKIKNDTEISISYELDKLLAGLTITFEYFNQNSFKSSDNESSTSIIKSSSSSSSYVERNDAALLKLNELRKFLREDSRVKRQFEDKISVLQEEIVKLNNKDTARKEEINDKLNIILEKDNKIKEISKTLTSLKNELGRRDDEVNKIRIEDLSLINQIEHEKTKFEKQKSEIENILNNNSNLKLEVDRYKNDMNLMKKDLHNYLSKISMLTEDLKAKDIQNTKLIENNDANNIKTLKMETLLNEKIKESNKLEENFISTHVSISVVDRLKEDINQYKSSIIQYKLQINDLNESKVRSDHHHQFELREFESNKKKLSSLQNKVDNLTNENESISNELLALTKLLSNSKDNMDNEYSLRIKSETALDISKKNNIDMQNNIIYYKKQIEMFEEKERSKDNEINNLRLKSNLQLQKIEDKTKESLRDKDEKDKKKMSEDIIKLRNMLDTANKELTLSSERSSVIRAEGRKSREKIQEGIGRIKEVVNIVRTEASNLGMKSTNSLSSKSNNNDNLIESSSSTDSYGMNELLAGLDSLREIVIWFKDDKKIRDNDMIDIKSNLSKIEGERNSLEKTNKMLKTTSDSVQRQLQDDISRLKAQLLNKIQTDDRISSNSSNINQKQIALFEHALQKEKIEKNMLQTEINSLKERLNDVLLSNYKSKSSNSNPNHKTNLNIDDNEKLKSDLFNTTRQRDVLVETISNLENQLRMKVDEYSNTERENSFYMKNNNNNNNQSHIAISNNSMTNYNDISTALHHYKNTSVDLIDCGNDDINDKNDEIAHLKSEVDKYRNRGVALEELVTTYRSTILNLCNDNNKENNINSSKSVLIEREINSLKRRYNNEMSILEEECKEVRMKLKNNNSYTIELRKRFEESMKSMYRPGKSSSTDLLLQELSQTSLMLQKYEDESKIKADKDKIERHSRVLNLNYLTDALAVSKRLEVGKLLTDYDFGSLMNALMTAIDSPEYSNHVSLNNNNNKERGVKLITQYQQSNNRSISPPLNHQASPLSTQNNHENSPINSNYNKEKDYNLFDVNVATTSPTSNILNTTRHSEDKKSLRRPNKISSSSSSSLSYSLAIFQNDNKSSGKGTGSLRIGRSSNNSLYQSNNHAYTDM